MAETTVTVDKAVHKTLVNFMVAWWMMTLRWLEVVR